MPPLYPAIYNAYITLLCYNICVTKGIAGYANRKKHESRDRLRQVDQSILEAVPVPPPSTPAPAQPVEEQPPSPTNSINQFIQDRYESASPEEQTAIKRTILAALAAKSDSVASFKAFYEVVHATPLPRHSLKWIRAIYAAKDNVVKEKEGVIIRAFRGSGKTTTLTITWAAYRIGKEPHKSNLLIQVGDDIAADNSNKIADIIMNNPGWKMVFPHVVPDTAAGWGAGGYEVKRTDLTYPEWRQLNAQRKDPTFVGVGYKSREIIGKHPTGLLLIDDIHDENNTVSEKELETTRKIVTSTIMPTRVKGTLVVVVGTPWVDGDVLHYLEETGQFISVRTPAVTIEHDIRTLAWPEVMDEQSLRAAEKISGQVEFARMYLLDLSASRNRVFRFQSYPADKINPEWIMAAGVDYAGNMTSRLNASGKGDYFAMCYLAKMPGHGLVVVDGVLDRPTQAEAEAHVKRPQELYRNWRGSGVESDGRGLDFIQVLRRNPGLKIIPLGTGKRSKATRLEKEMGPWLENGTIWISDAQTPFLNELRRELNDYPLCAHDDALDAMYYAILMFPETLSIPSVADGLPQTIQKTNWLRNPFASLRRA